MNRHAIEKVKQKGMNGNKWRSSELLYRQEHEKPQLQPHLSVILRESFNQLYSQHIIPPSSIMVHITAQYVIFNRYKKRQTQKLSAVMGAYTNTI